MSTTSESTFKTRDGTELYTKTWTPTNPSSIHIIHLHGFSDHINAYKPLFEILSSPQYNITIHGFDQRGWGRSALDKKTWGLTGATAQVLSDIDDFVSHIRSHLTTTQHDQSKVSENARPKLFLMGHSMGGGEALMYLLSKQEYSSARSTPDQASTAGAGPSTGLIDFSGLILESPYIALPPESAPSSITVFVGRLLSRVLPSQQMVQKLDPAYMSRDPAVCRAWADDPLCHDTGTLAGLAGLLDRAAQLDALSRGQQVHSSQAGGSGHSRDGLRSTLPCPIYWVHGDADKVCDYASSKRLYDRLSSDGSGEAWARWNRFVNVDGGYHKLHAEPEGVGEQFANGVGEWVLDVAGQGRDEMGSKTGSGERSKL